VVPEEEGVKNTSNIFRDQTKRKKQKNGRLVFGAGLCKELV
jgi:hypothetical protein